MLGIKGKYQQGCLGGPIKAAKKGVERRRKKRGSLNISMPVQIVIEQCVKDFLAILSCTLP